MILRLTALSLWFAFTKTDDKNFVYTLIFTIYASFNNGVSYFGMASIDKYVVRYNLKKNYIWFVVRKSSYDIMIKLCYFFTL